MRQSECDAPPPQSWSHEIFHYRVMIQKTGSLMRIGLPSNDVAEPAGFEEVDALQLELNHVHDIVIRKYFASGSNCKVSNTLRSKSSPIL